MADVSSGWGRLTWGQADWDDSTVYATGWGAKSWNDGAWGELKNETITLTGFEISGSMGPHGWGAATWGNSTWGDEPFALTTTAAMALGITGLEATGSVGTPQINYDFTVTLTESLLMTGYLGSLSINNGADHTQGLGGIPATASLGTPVLEMAYTLTGLSSTMSVGTLTITQAQLVNLTGIEATGSLGTLGSIDDMAIGLTGISSTMSLGTPTVDDMAVGLTGLSITGSVGQNYVVAYADESITGSTAYSVDTHANTSYTVEKHIPNQERLKYGVII